jgi:TonB family protein
MSVVDSHLSYTLGLLPEPERRPASFFTSAAVNFLLLGLFVLVGMTARQVIDHRYEQTVLIFPTAPPPPVKLSVPPRVHTPKPPELKLDRPKLALPKIEPKPEPLRMEAKVEVPVVKAVHPAIVLAPQPKPALEAAAAAQTRKAKPVIGTVHLGEVFGVTPNPNATRPATVAAIGNPYGGMNGPATAPRGIVGSTGIGDGAVSGSSSSGYGGRIGKVAPAGIPAMAAAPAPSMAQAPARANSTSLMIISKPQAQYTSEARQLKIQGDVILRVTFTSAGQVVVHDIVQGLGHGLDEEARRVAQQIQFRPATRNGQAMDLTTNITITFQLA